MEKTRLNKTLLSLLLWLCGSLLFGLVASLAGIYLYLSPNLPSIESLRNIELQTPLRVYSIDNRLIGEFGEKRRIPMSIDEAPQPLLDAILAAEDDAFYEHKGVSVKSLLRATSELLLSGEIQTGGSTITMQVARNFFLSLEQTFSRKFNEILLALKIERALSKAEILELYLNKIYLGNRAYGFKAAAQAYYGTELQNLNLAQLAMIAGLPKAPSTFNPIANPSRALIRRDWILKRMQALGKITPENYDIAIGQPVTARYYGQNLDLSAPYIAELARERAIELFGEDAYNNGYKIYTTVDSRLQDKAQQAVINGLLRYDIRHGYRGPEQQLDPSSLQPLTALQPVATPQIQEAAEQEPAENAGSSTSQENNQTPAVNNASVIAEIDVVDLTPWLAALKRIPAYGGLEPGVVIRISTDAISVLNAFGKTIDIAWDNGLKNARPYVNENFAGDPPSSPDKVVAIGDVIRFFEKEGNWHFSQIPEIEAALISINPDDGSVSAMVGGFDFAHSSFNRVTQAKRQPGSNFKPFIYTIALENNMSPATIFNDAPIVVEDRSLESTWRPENASGKFYGPTRLRKALYLSRNLVSIRLLRALGVKATVDALERFGVNTSDIPKDLSMALGTHVMTPMDVATGYSVFANGGYRIDPYVIHHIRDRHDTILYTAEPKVVPEKQALAFTTVPLDAEADPESEINDENSPSTDEAPPAEASTNNNLQALEQLDKTAVPLAQDALAPEIITPESIASQQPLLEEEPIAVVLESTPAERIVDERVIYIMNSMLRDVVKRGTARRALSLGRGDLAGKTGTTNGPTDAWFSGFNSHLVTTTWVGFDNNQKLGRGEYGGVAALPIWTEFMEMALDNVSETLPPQPNGIVTVRIDPETGQRTAPSNPNGIFELFLEEAAPDAFDPATVSNIGSDKPATEDLF